MFKIIRVLFGLLSMRQKWSIWRARYFTPDLRLWARKILFFIFFHALFYRVSNLWVCMYTGASMFTKFIDRHRLRRIKFIVCGSALVTSVESLAGHTGKLFTLQFYSLLKRYTNEISGWPWAIPSVGKLNCLHHLEQSINVSSLSVKIRIILLSEKSMYIQR